MAAKTEECPNCGAEFRAGRLACPECGSDAATGWRSGEDIEYESLELPERDDAPVAPRALSKRFMLIAAVLALAGFAALAVLGR